VKIINHLLIMPSLRTYGVLPLLHFHMACYFITGTSVYLYSGAVYHVSHSEDTITQRYQFLFCVRSVGASAMEPREVSQLFLSVISQPLSARLVRSVTQLTCVR
jgi:hypothetical protein